MENGEVTLLTNVDDGSNRLVIDGNEIPYSYWVGTGVYTYGSITITKTSSDSLGRNLALKEVGENKYAFTTSAPSKGLTFDDVYPVGSIYMSVNQVNPATLFGGTWEAWGSGKVPIGVDTSDSDFNEVEKSGGSKSQSYTPGGTVQGHKLTVNEMPSHHHALNNYNGGGNIVKRGVLFGWDLKHGDLNYQNFNNPNVWSSDVGGNATHNHGFSGTTATLSKVQPYITCYMWKRIA